VKKVLFLLFTCLLLVALVLPACKPGPAPTGKVIKIGVIGPMQYIQGENHWWGAEMARDEINAAGGIKIGGDSYQIALIQSDSNEINSITDASSAMEKLITVDKADFVIGGFRTEAVFPMQEVAMDNKEIFLNCGAATLALNTPVGLDYDRYKYYFRVTPFCSTYLVYNMLMEIGMAGAILKEETGINRKLRVAVCSEGAEWADAMTQILNTLVPSKLKMEVSGTWRPSPTATEVTAEMTAMEQANTDIIASVISGPLGIPFGRSFGELKIAAVPVGINVESQNDPGYWANTNGLGNYDTGLSSFARGLTETPLTVPFVDKFIELHDQVPAYNAGTYDAIYILKSALERAGSDVVKADGTFDSDVMVASLEQTDQVGTVAPRFMFTGMDAELKNPHDVTYGPGFSTGIATQWQDGKMVAVWPNPAYGDAYVAAGFDPSWKDVNYGGIVKWKAPPELLDKLKAEAATQPAAPPEEQPAAPPAGGAAPPAAGAVSFEAKTYDGPEFTFQYPKEWEENPSVLTTPYHQVAFSVPNFIPGVVVLKFDADAPESKDWILQSYGLMKAQDPKVKSDITEETSDGNKAYTYNMNYISSTGYEIMAYNMDVDKGDKRYRISVYTIDAFSPYDGALFSEIAHTFKVK
jgi:branched-chain amino acid transport system substrate-binding protein